MSIGRQPRILDRVRNETKIRHYSHRTEQPYLHWIRRYIYFHKKHHPQEMGEKEITAFLAHLAVDRKASPSTQNQALSAILFLYQKVLQLDLPWLKDVVRAKRQPKIPMVFTENEVKMILGQLEGAIWLIVSLIYGAGLRVSECVRPRVKDFDFDYKQIIVRNSKGGKDRVTVLSGSLIRQPAKSSGACSSAASTGFRTTQIYTHVSRKGAGAALSPLDSMNRQRNDCS